MASEVLLKSGFVPTSMNGNSFCQLAMPCRTINNSLVEFHKDQYLAFFFSYSVLMISTRRLAACTQAVVIMRSTSFIAIELKCSAFEVVRN